MNRSKGMTGTGGILVKRKKKWLIFAALCVVLFSLYFFRGHIERIILERTLPGEWTLLAGGGFETCTFDEDGTVTITDLSGTAPYTTTWRLENASSAQKQSYWSHPNVILIIGSEEYGIGLKLDSSNGLYDNGKKVYKSLLSFSFSLTFRVGSGVYVRPY